MLLDAYTHTQFKPKISPTRRCVEYYCDAFARCNQTYTTMPEHRSPTRD